MITFIAEHVSPTLQLGMPFTERTQSGSLVETSRIVYRPNVFHEVANTGKHWTPCQLGTSEADRTKEGGESQIHQLFLKQNTGVPSSAPVERLYSVAEDAFARERGNTTDENLKRQLINHETKTVVYLIVKVMTRYFWGKVTRSSWGSIASNALLFERVQSNGI